MNKEKFIKLLEKAKKDRYGNLYYIDDECGINNRVYFWQTIGNNRTQNYRA